jgi:serralysin
MGRPRKSGLCIPVAAPILNARCALPRRFHAVHHAADAVAQPDHDHERVQRLGGAAIYGPAPTAWSVTNTTTIQNTAITQGNTTTPAFGILLVNGGTIVNDAGATIISGGAGVAIEHTGGTLVNSGCIASTGAQAVGAHRYIGAAVYDGLVKNEAGGTISGYAGVGLAAVYSAGSYGSAGSLTNAAGGVISGEILITGGTYAHGVIAVNGSATITNSGSVSVSSFFNRGVVSVTGGQFSDATTLAAGTGAGTLDIGAGGTAALAAGSAADQTIAFTAAGGTLAIAAGTAVATPITGFAAGDLVRITNGAVTRLGITAGANGTTQVTAFAGNQAVETLSFATPPLTGLFGFAPDAAGGSDLAFAHGALLNGVLSVPDPTAGITYEAPPGVAAVALGGAAAVGLEDTANGNLLLTANTGADTITSAVAGDTLAGGGGAAVLGGTAGQNTVFRDGGGSVRMTGGNGTDIFIGTTGNDTITTGTGNNLIVPGSGNDLILSNGQDVLFPDPGGSETVFAAGHLLAAAGAGAMFLINGANPASVIGGGSGSVVINGGAGGGLFAAARAGRTSFSAAPARAFCSGPRGPIWCSRAERTPIC